MRATAENKVMNSGAERSRSRHRAFFDFAQNEDELDVPSTIYHILSEVEGRTVSMRCSRPSLTLDPRFLACERIGPH
jgi:hypothetical protein